MRNLVGWKLRGRVHTLRTEHADWDNVHQIWLPPQGTTLVTFRPDGQVSDEERRNPDDSLTHSHSIYDEKGRLIEEQWRKDNEPPFRIVHVYDDDGRLSEMFYISKEGHSRLAERHQYDATGRKTKIQFFDPAAGQSAGYGAEGSQLGYPAPNATTCTTLYDDQQLPYEATCRDGNGAVVLTVEITRDERGHVVREVARFGAESPFAKRAADIEDDERGQLAAVLAQVFFRARQ